MPSFLNIPPSLLIPSAANNADARLPNPLVALVATLAASTPRPVLAASPSGPSRILSSSPSLSLFLESNGLRFLFDKRFSSLSKKLVERNNLLAFGCSIITLPPRTITCIGVIRLKPKRSIKLVT